VCVTVLFILLGLRWLVTPPQEASAPLAPPIGAQRTAQMPIRPVTSVAPVGPRAEPRNPNDDLLERQEQQMDKLFAKQHEMTNNLARQLQNGLSNQQRSTLNQQR
jgi:hypothetical protein